jgi:NAD-reducing hydrogenase small subunit
MNKLTVATVWLDGCSGCHMSFLDMDERLIELAEKIEMVYGPFVDPKELPKEVDLGIIEGAVSNEDDYKKALKMRKACKFIISLGDCAVNGNVPSMRNIYTVEETLKHVYHQNVDHNPVDPVGEGVPPLKKKVLPVHHVIKVDLFVQGCPPSGDVIYQTLTELLQGKTPTPSSITRFGA